MEEVVLTEKDVPGAYISGNPADHRLPVLKRWLECHGQKKSVKLPEAIERVRICIAMKMKVDIGVDGGKWYQLKKQGTTAQSAATVVTASAPNEDGWTTFPSINIPDMYNYGHAYHYLVDSISQFGHKIDNDSNEDSDSDSGYATTEKPLRKGNKLMRSGFVEDIQDNQDETHYYLPPLNEKRVPL